MTDGRTDKSTATTTANTALAWRRAVEKEEENEHRWAFTEPLSARDTAKKIWNRASSRDANANRRNASERCSGARRDAECAAGQVATNRRRRRRRRRGSRTALTTSNTMSEPVKPAERDRGQGHGQGHGQGRGQDPVPLKPSDRLAAWRSG